MSGSSGPTITKINLKTLILWETSLTSNGNRDAKFYRIGMSISISSGISKAFVKRIITKTGDFKAFTVPANTCLKCFFISGFYFSAKRRKMFYYTQSLFSFRILKFLHRLVHAS